ncbi:MAG: restriction endonuclease subunit S [Candidatus Omnitrophica bacterium]|nr:restriction endonuclease subunit S [Candidatus Omnitrophota bacterium]
MVISEIKYEQVIERLRFDAEHYQPAFLENEMILKRVNCVPLREVANFSKARRNPENIPEEEFEYIDISNINIFTGEITTQKLKGYRAPSRARKVVRENDIILSTVRPNRNAVAIIPKKLDNEICSTGFSVIKTRKINPWFLFAFLKTKYAINQLVRLTMASMYPAVSEEDIGTILIPLPSPSFQENIETVIRKSYKKLNEANAKYNEAESLLNKILGIERLDFNQDKIFEVGFDEVEPTLRFDAEHHQLKYKQIKKVIYKSGYKVKRLKEVVRISTKKIDPTQEPAKYFNYIELANINPSSGEIEEYSQIIGHKAPSRARMVVKTKDVLVASLSGSLDNVGLVPHELDGAIASTGFFVISSEHFLSEFLFLLFRSDLMKFQLEEKAAGAIMSAVPKTTFGDLLIPLVPLEKQRLVSNLIKEFFSLRKEAKGLLEKAKKEVEQYIEKGRN